MHRVIAGVAALLVALCLATETFAHASLVSAEPADGSVVASAPKTLQLQFNESVTPAVVSLIDAAGKTRAVTVRAVDRSVVIVLPDDLPQGTQVVSYRVVSQDGHPVAGSLVFSIGVVTSHAAKSNGGPLAILIWLARIGVYLGLFAGIGGVFFAAWIGQGSRAARVDYGGACRRSRQRCRLVGPAGHRPARSSGQRTLRRQHPGPARWEPVLDRRC